jgi:hypothetical protein
MKLLLIGLLVLSTGLFAQDVIPTGTVLPARSYVGLKLDFPALSGGTLRPACTIAMEPGASGLASAMGLAR